MKVAVVGAGVIGLTLAVKLQETGHEVTVYFRKRSLACSNVAGAVWYPSALSPKETVRRWALETLSDLVALSRNPGSGVRLARGVKLFDRPMGNPWWRESAPSFRRLDPRELEKFGARAGYELVLPVADMPVYLRELAARFQRAGGKLVPTRVRSLDELLNHSTVVVNASGAYAKWLAGDRSLSPVKGQVVVVEGSPSLEGFVLWHDRPSGPPLYLVSRGGEIVVGATSERRVTSLRPDPATEATLLDRARAFVPGLQKKRVLSSGVGFRPERASVRCEEELRVGGGRLIHAYGHGGAGFTLSWGTAAEVLGILEGT